MADQNEFLPDQEPFFPEGSVIIFVAHFGVGLFFIMTYFVLPNYIETFKMLILGYYTLFSTLFLFFYHQYLRVRRIFLLWCVIGILQLAFYFININSLMWGKWAFGNVLGTLAGLPVALALYQAFRRMALKDGKELVIGFRTLYKPTKWDIAASIVIPVITLLVCLF